MSNALAIASVTRVLKDLLNNGLIDHDVSDAVGGNVLVTALPPDRILGPPGTAEQNQINLFLHQVTPNPGWRNADLPTRDTRGERVNTPLLALDLHYLLTAFGADELNSEILLGYAMQLLHENPVLRRDAIRTALASPAVNGGILPPAFQALAASDLADQVELIKITPQGLSSDEMSKVWTALQTHYRPSTGYEVSVVLIEGRQPQRTPLPVLTRGRGNPTTGRDEGVFVQANLLPPYPTLERIELDQEVAARMSETITLHGHHLDGDQVFIRLVEPRSGRVMQLQPLPGATAARVQTEIPPDPPAGPVTPDSPLNPANWRAGLYGVTVLVQRAGEPDRTTNELPLALAPTITNIAPSVAGDLTTFVITAIPAMAPAQRIALIVGDREIPAANFGPGPSGTVAFQSGGFAGGEQFWVRLRVDNVESLLIDRSSKPPAFDPSQRVTIP